MLLTVLIFYILYIMKCLYHYADNFEALWIEVLNIRTVQISYVVLYIGMKTNINIDT